MTIEHTLHQFRAAGRVEVDFSTAYARRELILGGAVTLLMLILTIATIPGSLADLADAELSAGRRALAAAVILLFLVAVLIMVPLVVLAVRRLIGASPGLVLTTDGVRVARQAGPLRPAVSWSTIRDIEIQRSSRGQLMVALVGEAKTTSVPIGLAHDAQELHDLLESARLISTGPRRP
ncbi:hypothetical protein [Ruania zhangjianzhongii]|uniref:hypothetical protein n=1 Tax=Ruania zhangjianzhongii TaxID=2603206 RepID=UPI0011C89AA8|nr:hypothetical protein [Ruania zhangjianzhongii]